MRLIRVEGVRWWRLILWCEEQRGKTRSNKRVKFKNPTFACYAGRTWGTLGAIQGQKLSQNQILIVAGTWATRRGTE